MLSNLSNCFINEIAASWWDLSSELLIRGSSLSVLTQVLPELFLVLVITALWCYQAVGGGGDVILLSIRLLMFISLALCIYITPSQAHGYFGVIDSGIFVWLSKLLLVVAITPLLWFRNYQSTSILYLSMAVLFGFGLLGSLDMLTTYVSLEGLSLLTYGVIATNKSVGSSEAGLKYFLYGVIASALLVFGFSILYIQTQTLSWNNIYFIMALANTHSNIEMQFLAIVLILSALTYKLSMFPFQFTLPDVYEGASWYTITIINVGVKLSIALFVFKVWGYFNTNPMISSYLSVVLALVSIGSIIVGCFGAIMQTSLKRFFAYTSINQSGFIVLGLLTNTIFGLEASLLYVVVYTFSLLLFFVSIGNSALVSDDITEINKTQGIKRLGIMFSLFSMAGIPPLFGFISKYVIWLSLFDAASCSAEDLYYWSLLVVLSVSILTSLVSAFYYLRLVKVVVFENIDDIGFNFRNDVIGLFLCGFLILWPLFINVLLGILSNWALCGYGSWIEVLT